MRHSDDKKGFDQLTASQREKFLEAIAAGDTVSVAVKAAGVSRATVYRWKDEDLVFSQAWYDAHEEYVDGLEAMARKRTINVGNTMLIFLLKSYRPHVFGDGRPRDTRPRETRPIPEETLEDMTERIKRERAQKLMNIEARERAGDPSAALDRVIFEAG